MEIPSFPVGNRRIGPDAPVFIIGEAGVNANGDLALATRLVDAAAEAGVDAVKFQSFLAEDVAAPAAPKAPYQIAATGDGESQREMLKRMELSPEHHRALQHRCESRGIMFLSTPFSERSADLLDALAVPLFKISSGDLTNTPLLVHVARKGRPILLSTGMSSLDEVAEAVRLVRSAGCTELALLHCVSSYPADPEDAELRAIATMREAFHVPVGYSDHTLGMEVAAAAVALGACVIEKHFTLDRSLPGPDQRMSLEPAALGTFIAAIRNVQRALGTGVKRPTASEMSGRLVARRSLAAATDLPRDTVLAAGMLKALRPATGIPPASLTQVVGRRLRRPLASGEVLTWDDLE